MDNTGNYVTYEELFNLLYPSTYVSERSSITLSGKSGNTFNYVSNLVIQVGDVITQGQYAVKILSHTTTTLTVDSGTNIDNGDRFVYRLGASLETFNMLILGSMYRIDLYTGQWFNKRTMTVEYEGNNSQYLHLSVPIIEVTSLKTNNDTESLGTDRYHVFTSRTIPDDRRNPRIKLVSNYGNIYRHLDRLQSGVFYEGMFTKIEGSFGYLEPDGSTPYAIKWAVSRMVMKSLNTNLDSVGSGSIKREKTDLHEIEYDVSSNKGSGLHQQFTGDQEVDRVILMYKSPIAVGGTNPLFKTVTDFYQDYRMI